MIDRAYTNEGRGKMAETAIPIQGKQEGEKGTAKTIWKANITKAVRARVLSEEDTQVQNPCGLDTQRRQQL